MGFPDRLCQLSRVGHEYPGLVRRDHRADGSFDLGRFLWLAACPLNAPRIRQDSSRPLLQAEYFPHLFAFSPYFCRICWAAITFTSFPLLVHPLEARNGHIVYSASDKT